MIDKYLITKLNELFPPASSPPKSFFVDGVGYEPQEDGTIRITDKDGNEITTVWRSEDGSEFAYTDTESGQCVVVSEEDFYSEWYSECDPERQSCMYYHDESEQLTNLAQRFAETPAQSDTPIETPAHTSTQSQSHTTHQLDPDTESHTCETCLGPDTKGAPVMAHSFAAQTGAQAPQPVIQIQVADSATHSQVTHQSCPIHVVQSEEQSASSPVSKSVDSKSEVETVLTDSGAVVVEGAALCASNTEAAMTAAMVKEAIMAEKLSDDLAAASGQVFVTPVASETAHGVEVQVPVPETANVEHQRANPRTAVTAVVTVENDPHPESERSSRATVSVADAEAMWDPQEFFFVGSPMFFMPLHEGAGVTIAMQQMTQTQERVANVGSRGNPPDHEDSQGNRDRDDGQSEEDEETPAAEAVA